MDASELGPEAVVYAILAVLVGVPLAGPRRDSRGVGRGSATAIGSARQ